MQRMEQPPEQLELELEDSDQEPEGMEEDPGIQSPQQREDSRPHSTSSAPPTGAFGNLSITDNEVIFNNRVDKEDPYREQHQAQMQEQEPENTQQPNTQWEHGRIIYTINQIQERYSSRPGPNRGTHNNQPQPHHQGKIQ